MLTVTKKFFLKKEKIFLSFLFLFVYLFSFVPVSQINVASAQAGNPGFGMPNGTDLQSAITGSSSSSSNSTDNRYWYEKMVDAVVNLPASLPLAIVGTFVYVIAKVTYWVSYAAVGMLNLVLSPDFISYSYTTPAKNPIIETGLAITQSFVNMMLVVFLVYIALATILRLAGYETKKVLINFIIIALLVNFSPVFCGLVVDASNIAMNFFIQADSGQTLGEAASKGKGMGTNLVDRANETLDIAGKGIWENVATAQSGAVARIVDSVVIMAAILIMLIFAGIIYLMYVVVFTVRYFAIWILVILSPIAFVSYVLPKTRGMIWEKWYSQFISWCTIGITCSFFLYLAGQFGTKFISGDVAPSVTSSFIPISQSVAQTNSDLYQAQALKYTQTALNESKSQDPTIIAQTSTDIIPNTNESVAAGNTVTTQTLPERMALIFIPVLFLTLGLFFGFQTSAMGAGAVLSFSKRWGTKTALAPTRAGGRIAASSVGGIGSRINAVATGYGMGTRDIAHGITSRMENSKALRWFVPESVRKYGQQRPAVEEAKTKLKGYSNSDLAKRVATGGLIGNDATAAITQIMNDGDSGDLLDAFAKKYGYSGGDAEDKVLADPRFKDYISTPLKIAQNTGLLSGAMMRKDPRMARLLVDQKWGKYNPAPGLKGEERQKSIKEAQERAIKDIVKDVKPGDIDSWDTKVLEDRLVMDSLMSRDRNVWESVSKMKRGQITAQESIDKAYTDWMKTQNITSKQEYDNVSDKGALWKKFDEHMTTKNDGKRGLFQYLEDPRARSSGWRTGQWSESGEVKTTMPIGATMNLPPTKPGVQEPIIKPAPVRKDTGLATRRVRSIPDVGNPGPTEAKRKESPINKK